MHNTILLQIASYHKLNCFTALFYTALFCLLQPPGSLNASEAKRDSQRPGGTAIHFKLMASVENQAAERIQQFDLISDCTLPAATFVNNLVFVCKLSWKNIQLLLVSVVPYKVRRRRELSNTVSALT